jgi:hypothetical protein
MGKSSMTKKQKLKEYEILDVKAYIVHAFNEDHALRKFGNYDYVEEGDTWPEVRELGLVNDSGTGPRSEEDEALLIS